MANQEAADVADLLNTVCGATVEALRRDDIAHRRRLRRQLARFAEELEEEAPQVAEFLTILERWLSGQPPSPQERRALGDPYARVLQQMMAQVEPRTDEGASESTVSIGETTLTRLVAAVVTAAKHADENPAPARRLAAHLVNVQQQVPASQRNAAHPFFENLRAVLSGVDPRTLQEVPDEPYASLWQTARSLLSAGEAFEETTRDALLDRLVHNAVFVVRAGDEELRQALAQALLDVQRSSIAGGDEDLATFVAAIRAHLLGLDPTPHSSLLDGEELAAWRTIQRAGESHER